MSTVADQLRARVVRESRRRIIREVLDVAQTRATEDRGPQQDRPAREDASFSDND